MSDKNELVLELQKKRKERLEKISFFNREIEKLKTEVGSFDSVINSINSEKLQSPPLNGSQKIYFFKTRSFKERVYECVEQAGKFISAQEIADAFTTFYPKKKEADLKRQISTLLSNYKKAKKLITEGAGKSTLWGLPEWGKQAIKEAEFPPLFKNNAAT